ncbi:MAG: cytidine deaminase [Anaerolineaceae bacterium]|nr:cytidine deaminase [Anaerolineaceae bacterium]
MALTNEQKKDLIERALQARQWAYTPYSGYNVGAALLSVSGKVYEGVNIENAAFSPTVCAERVAVFKAVSEGERDFEAIAVATENGGTPCGVCRQVLAEFAINIPVIIVNDKGEIIQEVLVSELLPGAFTADDFHEKK